MSKKRIILIGSSKNLLEKEQGNTIDSFDRIIRFNGFRIKGYEKHVGTKIDIFCFISVGAGAIALSRELNPFLLKECKELWSSRPLSLCGREYKGLKQIIRKYNKKPITHPSKEMFFELFERCKKLQQTTKHPSTGMVAIEMAIERFKDHDIYLTGFDQFATGHYYNNKKVKKCHPVVAEKIIIDEYITSGKLKIL